MTWTLVQSQVVNGAGSTAGEGAAAFSLTVTSGNLLLAIPGMNLTGQTTLPQVSGFTLAEDRLGTNCGVGIWYDRAASTDSVTVTATGLVGSWSLAIAEYSFSADGVPTLDQHADNAAGAGTSITGTVPTTTAADELVVAAVRTAGSNGGGSWNNFFIEGAGMNNRGAWAYLTTSGIQSFSTTYSWSGALNSAMAITSFKAVAVSLADRVKVRIGNEWVTKPSFIRQSNTWVPIT